MTFEFSFYPRFMRETTGTFRRNETVDTLYPYLRLQKDDLTRGGRNGKKALP